MNRLLSRFAPELAILLALSLAVPCAAQPYRVEDPRLAQLQWRSIGPWRGGRSSAVTGVNDNPKTFFMGTTGGGIWRSTDEGETWIPVSDGFLKTQTVGSLAAAPSNGKVIYAGMGEAAIRGNITPGDGVYKSVDGGESWTHMGLAETQTIGRIRVHPTIPDIVWAAALGPVFGPSKDRGVYKSTDGGKTWRKTLFVSDVAGAVEIALDPKNPDILFAATWECWRRPWEMVSGGPGSKLFKSTDGGEHWTDVSRSKGLPGGVWGRIGISMSPVDSNRIYMMLEAAEGGMYRSDDAGKTWERTSGDAGPRQRPWYFSNTYADPQDKDTVYVMNVQYYKSTDGGKTFRPGVAGHSDHHDMWIDPSDNKRLIMANDGGAAVSTNGGSRWSAQDYPTGQFYHVSTDSAFPYNILGAQQDNSTVRIASRTNGNGIGSADWTSTAGGESGYVVADPLNPDIVYGGNYGGDLSWTNHRTRMGRQIDPWPDNPIGRGAIEAVHRFQWTFPIVFSPNDPNVMYTGSQYVLRSRDRGASWETISPDLTTNDPKKQQSSGGPISKDNTAVEVHCTVFTIAESPVESGVIWAGSDDGLIHVTRDNGTTWTNVTPPDMPKGATVSMIDASALAKGRAFAAVNNYRQNDFRPYVFVTEDYGKSWKNVVDGIPGDIFVRVVREDPLIEGTWYAATEEGVYMRSRGHAWVKLGGLPDAPVHDIALPGREMVIATHGRGFYVLDNRFIFDAILAPESRLTVMSAIGDPSRFGPVGVGEVGKNPAGYGLRVDIWAKQKETNAVVTLKDKDGYAVARQKVSEIAPGYNQVYLSPSYPGMQSFTGLLMWSGYTGSLKAPPGLYTVEVAVDGLEQPVTSPARWMNSPGSTATDAEMVAKYELSRQVADMATECNRMVLQCRGYRTAIQESVKGDAKLEKLASVPLQVLDAVEASLNQGKARAGQDFLNFPPQLINRLAALLGTIQSGDYGPTKQSYAVFERLGWLYKAERDRFDDFVGKSVPTLNAALKAAGRPELAPKFDELRPARGGAGSGPQDENQETAPGQGEGDGH